MPTDKLLRRIQLQIDELAPTLELFVDDTIQPSVLDCETLQKQLHVLLENVAVYKYNKQNKEISPSFNIHAKLSAAVEEKQLPVAEEKKVEVVKQPEPVAEPIKKQAEPVIHQPEVKQQAEPAKVKMEAEESRQKPPMIVGLNDKFRFMNDLFAQNSSEYNIALEQINNLHNWNEGEIYLNSLKNVYGWDDSNDIVIYFYSLVKKRFD